MPIIPVVTVSCDAPFVKFIACNILIVVVENLSITVRFVFVIVKLQWFDISVACLPLVEDLGRGRRVGTDRGVIWMQRKVKL